MNIDTPIVLSFITIFLLNNLFGWGLFKDRRYIGISLILGLIYLLLDYVSFFSPGKKITKIKIVLLFSFICITVFGGSYSFMYLRNRTDSVGFINDSALQTEIAGRFLLLGKNPYSQPYTNTDLARWRYSDENGNDLNPALFVNVTPPFLIVLSAVGFRLFSQLFHWFDIRVFFLVAYFAVLYLGYVKFGFGREYLVFLVLIGMNPIFLSSMLQGANDIVILALLSWSLLLLEKKKFTFSAIMLALSVSAKQSAWFAIPIFLFYLWKQFKKKTPYFLMVFLGVIIIFYLPFALWDFPSLLKSLILYVNYLPGRNISIHPIEGFSFGRFLIALGLIKSFYDEYPFWLYQVIILLFLFFTLFLIEFKKIKMNSGSFLFLYTFFLAMMWFFNRYFLESHLGFLLVLLSLSYLWINKEKKTADVVKNEKN